MLTAGQATVFSWIVYYYYSYHFSYGCGVMVESFVLNYKHEKSETLNNSK